MCVYYDKIHLVIIMKIFVDADACPVINIIEELASENDIECILVCDHNHLLNSDYSEIIFVDQADDSADLKIMNMISNNDILITQDYGLASLALSKDVKIMNHFGSMYTLFNIDTLLATRHINQKIRSSKKGRVKGPKKRVIEDDNNFRLNFNKLISSML